MKFTVRYDMTADDLSAALPARLRGALRGTRLPEGPFTLVLFSGQRPVRGAAADKAIKAIDCHSQPLVAAAQDFTREAQASLTRVGALLLTRGEFYWSDNGFEDIETSVGATVKRPPK